MKKSNLFYESILSPESVDKCSQMVRSFLEELKIPGRDITRHALSIEEILLEYLSCDGEEKKFTFEAGIKLFKPFISLKIDGQELNVFNDKADSWSILGNSMLKNLGLSPDYYYTNNSNNYYFRIRKKSLNPIIKLAIVVFAAVALGIAGNLIPIEIRNNIINSVLEPFGNAFLSVLGCVAGPMIFLSVAWGIYGIGDASTLKKVGKKMLLNYIGTVYFFTAFLGIICSFIFVGNISSSAGVSSEFSSVSKIILGIIPSNIFSPFIEGNTLQIIFISVIFGIALLFMGRKVESLSDIVEQINSIIQHIIEAVNKLVPLYIFSVIVKMIWSGSFKSLLSVGRLFIVFICALLIMSVLFVLYTSISCRTNPMLIVKKALPPFFVAFTTASSAATFSTSLTALKTGFGVDEKYTSFGMPLGMVTFMPASAIWYMCISLFFAEMYGISVSATWIFIMIFMSALLSIAAPPIPGGSMTVYTMLFLQLDIPKEAVALALAWDVIIDFFNTGFNQFILPVAIFNQAKKLGLVDEKILRANNNNQQSQA